MWECNFGAIAKDILGNIKETPWNKEIIESWREVAVEYNSQYLHDEVNSIED